MLRPLENLSRRQRQATPLAFAQYLLDGVRRLCGVETVACLWVAERSIYHTLEGTDCWPLSRDAMTYAGPHPVICHPPCGPWGKHRANCFHSRDDGVRAMELVYQWGGVVEQPVGSELFRLWGELPLWGSRTETVDQSDFGHLALKPTLLYWFPSQRLGGAD